MEKFKSAKVSSQLFKILLPFVAAFVVFVVIRLVFGLGPTTNMNDGYPWGLWITYDVVVGTALGTGGYMMAFLIYLFNKGEYHPLIRSAVMTSAFGYTLAGLSVIIDLGRWWNFMSILTPSHFNATSVLLEVALCIIGYTVVTWIELVPVFLEKAKEKNVLTRLANNYMNNKKTWHKVLLLIIALGMLLPTMHQSSLGTMMVIAAHKLHPLWQTPFLPLLFLISVFFMGYSVVVAESFASSYMLGRPYETGMIKKLAPVISVLGLIWVVLRLVVLAIEGKIGLVFTSGGYSVLFLIEVIMVLYASIMIRRKSCASPRCLTTNAMLFLAAGSIYRFSAYLIAYNPGKGFTYFPSLIELFVTMGIIAIEFTLYAVFVKYLPVLPEEE